MGKASWLSIFSKAALISLTALVLSLPAARADENQRFTTVYALGSSGMQGEDISAGRDQAIKNSLVVAVTQVLTELMPPETLAGNFQQIVESILSHTDQFISDYQMLTETTHANTHHVLVKATVSVLRLKDALKQADIFLGPRQYPRVLLCIAEKELGETGIRFWWGSRSDMRAGAASEAIAKIVREKGFDLITPRIDPAVTAYPPELTVPEAVSLGQQQGAGVVVVGQAVAQETSGAVGADQKSLRAIVAVRAYSVQNGQQIGQTQQVEAITGDDVYSGGRQAIEKAARTAGEELSDRIATAWFSKGMGKSKIEIQVEGISGHIAAFVKLRGAMGTMSGVEDIQRKEMQADTAVLLVDYQGSARALADALKRQSFDTFSLQIANPEGNTIHLQIVPR
jgi:hypothetical protein